MFKKRISFIFISYLGVNADYFTALIAVVGKNILVALDAVGVVVSQYVPAIKLVDLQRL
jgi:hypothetical protein